MTHPRNPHHAPMRSLLFAQDHVASRQKHMRRAVWAGTGLAALSAGIGLAPLEPGTSEHMLLVAGQVALLSAATAWLLRGWLIWRRFAPVKDKAVLAALILGRRQNAELDATLYAVEQHHRPLTRIEASLLLARYYKEF